MAFNKVGVIGAGTMGIGVAVDLSLHGLETVIIDTTKELLDKAKMEIERTIRMAPLLKKASGKVPPFGPKGQITFTTSMNALQDVDFVIENVTEDWGIKEQVYKQLTEVCRPDVYYGVNTSCISITQIGGVTGRPERVIGMHFMNPVFLKEYIEVIEGFHTSEETVQAATTLLAQLEESNYS